MKRTSLALALAMAPLLVVSRRAEAFRQVPASRAPQAVVLPAVRSVTFLGSATKPTATTERGGSATGGQEVVLRVELAAPAPCVELCGATTVNGLRSGRMPVLLSGNNAAQFNLQRMFVPTGQTVGEVRFVTTPVLQSTNVMISARSEGSAPQQANLVVLPPAMTSFVIDKPNVVGGEVVHATVTFSGPPASAGAVKAVIQTTNSKVLKVPVSVVLEPGKTVAAFDIVPQGLDQEQSAQVVATLQDKILPVSVTVRVAVLKSIERFRPCCDSPFVISLDGRPPPQGGVIQLTSANPARMIVPPTATIPPDSTSVLVHGQGIPGNGGDHVRITVSYRGGSKLWSLYSWPLIKPDLVIAGVALTDRFGNAIAAPQDGQPFKMCATVRPQREGADSPNVSVPPSVLRASYRAPTGTGTSTGRDVDIAINFVTNLTPITSCLELPGLAPGGYYDVKLTADFRNEVDEDREGNNTRELKIIRPGTE
jgi:hypothetical protein